jgi:hypothetical protein
MKKIWKDVVGYEGLYRVSNYGDIFAYSRLIIQANGVERNTESRLLTPQLHPTGYVHIILVSEEGVRKQRTIHSIVADAFLGECPEGYEVDHKNDLRSDNRASNLQYLTHRDNCATPYHWRGTNQETSKRPVLRIGKTRKRFPSVLAASRHMGCNSGSITSACQGILATFKGFRWQYI